MAYDIYGNCLRRGYCEVHPDVPETYPCTICMRQAEKYYELKQQPYPTIMEYAGYDKNKFREFAEKMIAADKQSDEAAFLTAVENLICLLQVDFVSSVLHKMIEKEKAMKAEKVFHEKKIKTLERVISDIWGIIGECGDSDDADKLSRIETRLLDYEIEAHSRLE